MSRPKDGDADLPSVRGAGADRPSFFVYGAHRDHPRATEIATAAHALLVRYATEVVAKYGLCPFLRGVDAGLGAVGVILDTEPDLETAVAAIDHLAEPVLHIVYPVFTGTPSTFERFGSKLAEALRKRRSDPLVHASFHPGMTGGRENAYRLIGLLRQAPDPFVQFIPPGLQQGGTVMAGEDAGGESHADARFSRFMAGGAELAEEVLGAIAELREERERTYGELARSIQAGRG